MTTAPSFSPTNPKPKIYLAHSHDDFTSVPPAIFRSDLPALSCRFLTCHVSCSRLHQHFTLTCQAHVETFQACTSPRARSLADRQRFVWRCLLFQLPALPRGPSLFLPHLEELQWLCPGECWEGAVFCSILGGSRFTSTGNTRFPLEEVGDSGGPARLRKRDRSRHGEKARGDARPSSALTGARLNGPPRARVTDLTPAAPARAAAHAKANPARGALNGCRLAPPLF